MILTAGGQSPRDRYGTEPWDRTEPESLTRGQRSGAQGDCCRADDPERDCLVCGPCGEHLEWEPHQMVPQSSPLDSGPGNICGVVGGTFLFGCGELSREELRRKAQDEVARVGTPSQLYQ